MMRGYICGAALSAVLGLSPALAEAGFEVGRSDFAFSSELLEAGFKPFATSGVGSSIYGLGKGTQMYLCFIADQPKHQTERKNVIIAEISGDQPDRDLPNIPVVCVLTQ